MKTMMQSTLPLSLVRRGKVREVYAVDDELLLIVASDRVSAFDVVMAEPVPWKGAVLTQLSAFWFQELAEVFPSHFVTADTAEIIERVPALVGLDDELRGRAMLVRRTTPIPFECVVRGYLAGSAWLEYRASGTLAGEPLPAGLLECGRIDPPIFSPATKAETGHDVNVTFSTVAATIGLGIATKLRNASLAIYDEGRDRAAAQGIIIADTKFEFGADDRGQLLLIDEVLTPDSSRFWPADRYVPGRSQPSFDKQPLRDYLAEHRSAGRWDGNAPPPPLPDEVVDATSRRYRDAFRLLTGQSVEEVV